MHPERIIVAPLITEKAVGERVRSKYVFLVQPQATKIDVANAVEKMYKVKVVAVNTCRVRAKRKIVGRSIGKTSAQKKAYVVLAAGQKIEEIEA